MTSTTAWKRPDKGMEPTTKRKKEENGGKDANITKGKPCVSSTPGQLLERGLLSL